MPKIVFVESDGTRHEVEAKSGVSIIVNLPAEQN
jgi:hypothetical protein